MPRTRSFRRLGAGPWLVLGLLLLATFLTAVVEGQNPRFRAQGDGTVEETKTGLLWLADAHCWEPMSWREAKAAAAQLKDGMCGLKDGSEPGDWRLPTQMEWVGMVECSCGGIALTDNQGTECYASGDSAFQNVRPREYWSSTKAGSKGKIEVMSLQTGLERVRAEGSSLYLWPVRSASTSKPPEDGER